MEFCKMFRICWISHNTELDKLFNAWLNRFTPIKLGRECALLSASCSFMSYKENPWWHINIYIMMFPSQFVVNEVWYHSLLNQRFAFIPNDAISTVSCQKSPTRHAYAWQIGPFCFAGYPRYIPPIQCTHSCTKSVAINSQLTTLPSQFEFVW